MTGGKRWTETWERFRVFLKTDRAVLMFSISIALFFWFVTKMTKEYETVREVVIDYELPEGRIFLNEPPRAIQTTVRSVGWNLFFNYLGGGWPAISYPLGNESSQLLSSASLVNKVSATIGTKYEVLNVESDFISIKLDDAAQKKVPVLLDVATTLEQGFMPASLLRVVPDSFTVVGPASVLENMTAYPTEKLEIKDLSDSFSRRIHPKESEHPHVRVLPGELVLTQSIEQHTEGELLLPIEILNPPNDSVSILPMSNVFVKYRAPLSIFSEIDASDFRVAADLGRSANPSENNTQALEVLKQPGFTKIVGLQPAAIKWFIVEEVDSLEIMTDGQ